MTPAPLILTDVPAAEPTVVEVAGDIPVVQLRHTAVTFDDLGSIFDSGYSVLAQLGPIGPGYAIYDGDMDKPFDVTLGFPVAQVPAQLPDGVEASTFPGGSVLLVSHLGSFEDLMPAWERFVAHEKAPQSLRAIEIYVTDPSVTPVEQQRTDLLLPLS
ncbi:GyrI-like domain-containing protein [Nocardioides caeni]|nr:GyrI-like domain-containing protein [Nocardioides caeni]